MQAVMFSDYVKGYERRGSITHIVNTTEFNRCQVKAIIKAKKIPYEEKLYSPSGTCKIVSYKNYDLDKFDKVVNKLKAKNKLHKIISGF